MLNMELFSEISTWSGLLRDIGDATLTSSPP